MSVFYNEHDPFAAAWLRELIKGGHIPDGVVDERSIEDVRPDELREFTQCHFFAGIGGWPLALRRAGWPDNRPVWTGSCPCQPFSSAGKGEGFADERHLWPAFFHLICNGKELFIPVLGEQVAGSDGRAWCDLVHADMAGSGYAFGVVDAPAAGFGAWHIRQRLYWMANANGARRSWPRPPQPEERQRYSFSSWTGETLRDREGTARPFEPGTFPLAHGVPARVGRLRGYGNAIYVPQATAFIKAAMRIL